MDQAKHRTQISLEDWQYQILRDLSRRKRKSLSSIIRDLVTEKFAAPGSGKSQDPLWGIVGIGAGDGSSVAREHDRHLYGKKGKKRP